MHLNMIWKFRLCFIVATMFLVSEIWTVSSVLDTYVLRIDVIFYLVVNMMQSLLELDNVTGGRENKVGSKNSGTD